MPAKTNWPVDNFKQSRDGHFVVLVSFLDKISDPLVLPEVYVVPSTQIPSLIYNAPGGRRVIRLARMREDGKEFRDAWHLVL